MTTIRQMLPQVAQPFTEAIVGAGLGALVSRFVLKGDMTTGALVGGVAGYGLALTKARGAFPFTVHTAGGFYAGEEVAVLPAVDASGQQEIIEPVIEEVVLPEHHHHRRDDWWRRHGGGGGGWGRGGYGGWGHGWRR
jgi:hypothetical protein